MRFSRDKKWSLLIRSALHEQGGERLLPEMLAFLKSARMKPQDLKKIDLDVASASFSFSRTAWAVAKTFELVFGIKVSARSPKYYGKPNITTKKIETRK